MKLNKYLHLFITIFVVSAISFGQNKPIKTAKRIVKTQEIIDETPENDLKVQNLGYDIENFIYDDDIEGYMSKFDTYTFGRFITKSTNDDKSFDEFSGSFLKGVKKSISSLPNQILDEIENGSYYDFVSFRYDEEYKTYFILFRIFSVETGINYHDYRVSIKDDEFVFNDIYIYLSGETLSDSMSRMYIYSLPKEKVLGLFKSSETREFNNLLEGIILYREGDYVGGNKLFSTIKGKLSKEKFFLTLRTIVASHIDDEAYKAAIDELISTFPNDPTLYLAEIDYHIYQDDYDTALLTLDKLEKQTTDDFLNFLKGNLEVERGNYKKAIPYYKHMVDNYPDFFNGYSSYLICISETGDFKVGNKLLDALLEQGYDKETLVEFIEELNDDGSNEFAAYAKSRAFKKWKKRN